MVFFARCHRSVQVRSHLSSCTNFRPLVFGSNLLTNGGAETGALEPWQTSDFTVANCTTVAPCVTGSHYFESLNVGTAEMFQVVARFSPVLH